MVSFVLKRLGFALVTLVSVLTLVFLIVRILPGDPVLVILGDQASPESAAALRARLGLDQPILVQYAHFMWRAAQGDLGTAMVSGRPVTEEILAVLPFTLELTFAALVLGAVLASRPGSGRRFGATAFRTS